MTTEALDRLISSCIATLWRMWVANLLCALICVAIVLVIVDIRLQWIMGSSNSSDRSNVNSVNVGSGRTFEDNVRDVLIHKGDVQK